MQWRGQGILVVLVLAGAGAFTYQWKSMTHLEEEVRLSDFEYASYTKAVADFVEGRRRWPEPYEVALPAPKPGGVIKDVRLQNKGELLFTLTGWTITGGQATVLLAPELKTHPSMPHFGRLDYSCVEVNPSSFEQVMCMRIGSRSAAEINGQNENAFVEWEKNEIEAKDQADNHKAALETAKNTETHCDRLLSRAERAVLPCINKIDESAAQTLSARFQEAFNGPRLAPEFIARNPDNLNAFNQNCDENWNALAGLAKAYNAEFSSCFDQN